jgi:hypothetical protein
MRKVQNGLHGWNILLEARLEWGSFIQSKHQILLKKQRTILWS